MRAPHRIVHTLIWSFVGTLLIGLIAAVTRRPYLFPSLGPSALMIFGKPLSVDSSPRHVLVGHFIGAGAGYVALAVTGLLRVPFSDTIDSHRVLAAAIALALTAALTMLTKTEHAPAGATTLIVALGIMPRLTDFLFIMLAVVMLTLLALIVNRASGIKYPIW